MMKLGVYSKPTLQFASFIELSTQLKHFKISLCGFENFIMSNWPPEMYIHSSIFKKFRNVHWLEVQIMGSHDINDTTKYFCCFFHTDWEEKVISWGGELLR